MQFLKKIFQPLYVIWALFTFFVLMIAVVLVVLLLIPFGKTKGGNLIYQTCTLWGICWHFLIGIRYQEIYETPHNRTDQFIFVANHSSYMDAPCVARCMRQPVRVLGKYEMVRYPLFGIIYRAIVVVVDRSSPEKRAQSLRALTAALHKDMSIFIFPEGTFNMDDTQPLKNFYDGAFRLAIETQTPVKPIIFPDSKARMHWSSLFSLNPGKLTAVFLPPIPVDEYTHEDQLPALKKLIYDTMDGALRRYNRYPPLSKN